jgi:hypothetical protein
VSPDGKKKHTSNFTLSLLIPIILSVGYVVINLFFLVDFPFVHSDETWLGGLTRSMAAEGSLAATESFFDLYERNPHALKSFFHLLQLGWTTLTGYSLFSLRLLSLTAGSLFLFFLYRFIREFVRFSHLSDSISWRAAFFGTLLTAVDLQFIYASHTGRQEIWLLLLLIVVLYVTTRVLRKSVTVPEHQGLWRQSALVGLILGMAYGFHPNAAVISMPVFVLWGFFLAAGMTEKNRRKTLRTARQAFLPFILAYTSAAALFFIASLIMNGNFIPDYLAYGESLGVKASIARKITGLYGFYQKLFSQISGTYYTPDIRPQFLFYGTLYAASLFLLASRNLRRGLGFLLSGAAAVQAAFIAIGRYGQPSAVLNLPLAVTLASLLFAFLVERAEKFSGKIRHSAAVGITLLSTVLILGNALHTAGEVRRQVRENTRYTAYLDQIREAVPADKKVLGNINAEPAFAVGDLYDWRNIGALAETIEKTDGAGETDEGSDRSSFAGYIRSRNIAYIIYPEEMDVIYRQRPVWNGLYGALDPLYEEMQLFFLQQCEIVSRFSSRTYAMRIVRYQQEADWNVTVYRVLDD